MSNYDKEVKEAWERWNAELIDAQPTADVDYERGFIEGYTKAESDIFHGGKYAPVKHGRWNHNKRYGSECSECGYAMFELVGVRYTTCKPKYCPYCGAKMDKEDSENE